jgi:hypothetical protein
MSFWNLSCTQGGAIENVQITTASALSGGGVEPTHSNSYGIKLPQPYNANYTYVDGLSVGYWYTGVLQGELTIAKGLILGPGIVGLELGTSIHASMVLSMQVTGTKYGIRATGLHYCDVLQYDSEHYSGTLPAWMFPVYDLDDASNYLHGHIRWFDILAASITPPPSIDHVFLVNGGANALYEEIGAVPAGYITIKEEGSALATGATSLDFVGSSVTASGTGAAKTITIAATDSTAWQHVHVENVVFSGDGATTVFVLPASAVDAYSVQVFVTGSRSLDWTLSGAMLDTLTFGAAPASAANNIVVDIYAVLV